MRHILCVEWLSGFDRVGCAKVVGILNESKEHSDFIVDPGFSINVSDMGLYGTIFNIDDFGDLFIIETLADKFGDLKLSVRHAKAVSYIGPLLFGQQDDLGLVMLPRTTIIWLIIYRLL